MILLNTVLDKVITYDLILNNIAKILPEILQIIITLIVLIFCKDGIKFSFHMLRNS